MGQARSLSFRNVKGTYFWALEKRTNASWVNRIATTINTDQPSEILKWLEGAPAMTKFTGERDAKSLKDFGLTIVSDKFTSTLEFDIDDVRRDKTGQINRRVQELGGKAATLPERLLTSLITANPNGFDGAAFFATSHNHGGTCDNDKSFTTVAPDTPTTAEMSAAILQGVQAMYAVTDDQGEPANEEAMAFEIMVPVKYWAAARGALANVYTSAGVSNTLPSAGLSLTLSVNPRLSGAASASGRRFYIFRTDAPIAPCLWQEETIGDAFKTLGPDSTEAFWKEKVAFGAKRIGQAAMGQFLLAQRNNLA
jgi:hypothetical protein